MDLARSVFGDRFVAYCINSADGPLDSIVLSEMQQEAVHNLEFLARQDVPGEEFVRTALIRSNAFQYIEASRASLPNVLREMCGGSVAREVGDDPMEDALLSIASDIYPAVLLPAEVGGPSAAIVPSRIAGSVFISQSRAKIPRLILKDRALSKLFPEAPPADDYDGQGFEVSSMIYWSTGSGATLQLCNLAGSLLEGVLRGVEGHVTTNEFFALTRKALKDLRSLAEKKRVATKARIGLSNVRLLGDSPMRLNGGLLRQFRDSDHQVFFDPKGVKSVLEIDFYIQILKIEPSASIENLEPYQSPWDSLQKELSRFQSDLRRRIDLERLAILLACDEVPRAPLAVATSVANPIAIGTSVSFSVHHALPDQYAPVEVDDAMADRVARWSASVAKNPANMDMGMRRILSAVSERFDPLDSFVDAVICWENLFGTNQGEVSFRVAASISHLLEPGDAAVRKKLFKEVRDLYGVRSKLVHGSTEPHFVEAHNHRDRAVEIGIGAFKSLCERPDLLALDSSGRGMLLLIGA
ncbi:hypothetical protein ACFT8P_27150 [Streptomyces sp. NPDC057101]|uniref:hypothetical protein n=1 Tax=Streptomyces sp. NPDC057101 TaxID=3346020 RepID=UPI00363F1FC8